MNPEHKHNVTKLPNFTTEITYNMGTYVWRITLELIKFFKNPQWHNEQIFKSFSQKETRSERNPIFRCFRLQTPNPC